MPKKSSNKGCLIALAVIGFIGLLLAIGVVVAVVFVGKAVNDSVDNGGIPGLIGGDCVQFETAFATLTLTDTFTAGADESQRDEIDQALADLRGEIPSEIEDDYNVVADAYRQAIQAATPGVDPTSPELQEAEAKLNSPEVLEAQDNINRWIEENCT
jgi:hypothetical protein